MKLQLSDIENNDKFLCVCEGGNVRSVALATILKQKFKKDAVAIHIDSNSAVILSKWADIRIFMYNFPIILKKDRVLDVGEDIWGYSRHPDLIKKIGNMLGIDGYKMPNKLIAKYE